MPTLSVLDLAMFLLETQERPLNVGPLAIFTPPEGFRGNFANKLRQRMLARPIGEPFNYRLRTSVLGVPSLEVDPDADARKHVFRITLDGAADTDQLCATVCRLHEVRVDRSGLLWEVHIIDGLKGGKVAVYGKVHHGIIDGRTFVEVVSNWLSTSATDKTVRAMWEGVAKRPGTNRGQLSLAELVDSTIRQTAGAAKTALGLTRMVAKQALAKVGRDAAHFREDDRRHCGCQRHVAQRRPEDWRQHG
jgi:diacylglycerol O-acyltransferase